MDIYQRELRLERGRIDLETGEFPLTLFTNGEASDGHIIHIRGLEVDDQLPMFVNHWADPTERMGGLREPHKVGKTNTLGGASLKMKGVIDMQGESLAADVRRDVAQGISVGDITGMSGRWDPIEATPRNALKESHYAYSKIEGGWDTPMFFVKAKVLEGSIVGVPADSAALVGRSKDTGRPEHVRQFYDTLINGTPLSRERAMAALYENAAAIDDLEEIETIEGPFYVPKDVARVWGVSIEEEDLSGERELASAANEIAEPVTVDVTEPERAPVEVPVRAAPTVGVTLTEKQIRECMEYQERNDALVLRAAKRILTDRWGLVS